MNTVEEFTFPIIRNNNNVVHVSTAVLPPLWRIPSIINNDEGGAVHGRRITEILTTFVSSSQLPQIINSDAELEKMDVLWEDFNEELLLLQTSSSTTGSSSISESHIDHHHLHSNNNYYNTYGGELFHKRNESVDKSTKRRNNLELVFKMFNKVFLLPNIAATVKKTGHIS